jgi:hypothetical protein
VGADGGDLDHPRPPELGGEVLDALDLVTQALQTGRHLVGIVREVDELAQPADGDLHRNCLRTRVSPSQK